MYKDAMERERMIDNYVLGRMDEASRAEFESMMRSDETLRKDVDFIQTLKDSLTRRDENIRKMRGWEDSRRTVEHYASTGTDAPCCPDIPSMPAAPAPAMVIPWKKIASVAAACAVLFMCIYNHYSYHGLQDKAFWKESMRGDMITDITGFVEEGQYEIALDLIRETLAENPDVAEVELLKWTEIQTLLKMRKFEEAYDEVAEFREDAGRYYQKKADKLYRRLKVRLRK